MTMPADITTEVAWDRLVTTLRAQYRQVDDLYQRITEPEAEPDDQQRPEEKEPMTDPSTYPHRGYDPDADQRAAELEQEQRTRLDAETDGRLDGDYDLDPYDEPGLED